jgi:hypothetical protein
MTNAEREAQIAAHPETDTRPRYGDGTLVKPEDRATYAGRTGRLHWVVLTQEVPVRAWDAIIEGVGTVPLSGCRLHHRTGANA